MTKRMTNYQNWRNTWRLVGHGYKIHEEVWEITFTIVLQECPFSGNASIFDTKFNILSPQLWVITVRMICCVITWFFRDEWFMHDSNSLKSREVGKLDLHENILF
jgi:hypothetical protein